MAGSIVPPYLLTALAQASDPRYARAAQAARAWLEHQPDYERQRELAPPVSEEPVFPRAVEGQAPGPARMIYDAGELEQLPGVEVRGEGQAPTGDAATDEAYDGLGATFALLFEAYGRRSIDDRGHALEATVHYGRDYDNAFWNGYQMVFGDGDGEVFHRFTASLSVIGHELAHGMVQYTTNFAYRGQSGALNESVADVFGALVEQYARGDDAASASWLIGAGLFTDLVDEGHGLRSMKAPGTAYADDVLGRDPQPAHFDDYVETDADNGGVHLNSGIPNRAFYLVAERLGGTAWERAGQIWFDTIVSGRLTATTDFAEFAAATVVAAAERYGDGSEEAAAVLAGWAGVGIALD